jgi:LPS export ABC transporter permease LptG/LPS export ABC transporter permease LptF
MTLLGRYIFREIFSSALLGAFLATAVIFLQRAGTLFEILVQGAANWETVAYLFLLALPQVLPLTIPFGVLIGILIGLGRLSSDGEIIAMRAAGVSSRVVLYPVLTFALLSTALAAWASIRLTPWALRETYNVVNRVAASRLSVEIQPRVFEEQFTNSNTILYVGDVQLGRWRNVFMADLTPPEQRASGLREKADGPLVTVAREAIPLPDPEHSRIQLSLSDAWTHEMGKDFVANDTYAPHGEQALEVAPPAEKHARPFAEMNTSEVSKHAVRASEPNWVDASIELHRRLTLPFACMMLALVGVPLGVSSRKGGKSGGYVMGVFLAFFCYYLAFFSLMRLAAQRTLPVEVALWTPNAAFGIAGLVFLVRMERPGDRDLVGTFKDAFAALGRHLRSALAMAPLAAGEEKRRQKSLRLPLVPQLIDTYVLSSFLFYFVLLLASFVAMTQVYNFFELLGDIVAHKIPLSKVFTYLFFLIPKLIYDTLPISVLVAVLVTFGILTKNNEVTAFKACGISLHRLAAPILLMSLLLSAGLFAFDFYYVPEANVRQDALRNEIKGRPAQTYLRPDRTWIFGTGSRIYYYKFFDAAENVMGGVRVYELDPATFHVVRQIAADRAQWQASMNTWIFQNGWVRDFKGIQNIDFRKYQATTFPELNETPSWFLRKNTQDKQMNFIALDRYIGELHQGGFDTVKLRVQFYRKFSVPLFALIMAMLAVPFSFLVGNRGAMAGIGVSIGIAISYWGIGLLFEKLGDVNQLPPAVAAWAPDALFALTGLYLLLRMRS